MLKGSRALSRMTAAFLVTSARARGWDSQLSSGHAVGFMCSQVVEHKSFHKEFCYIILLICLCFRRKAILCICHLNYNVSVYAFVEDTV